MEGSDGSTSEESAELLPSRLPGYANMRHSAGNIGLSGVYRALFNLAELVQMDLTTHLLGFRVKLQNHYMRLQRCWILWHRERLEGRKMTQILCARLDCHRSKIEGMVR